MFETMERRLFPFSKHVDVVVEYEGKIVSKHDFQSKYELTKIEYLPQKAKQKRFLVVVDLHHHSIKNFHYYYYYLYY